MRSLLFVPADSPRKFARACVSAADALIIDFEDSVAPERKAAARAEAVAMVRGTQTQQPIWVRINPLDSEWAIDDLNALSALRPFGVVLPKSRSIGDVIRLSHYLEAFEVVAGIGRGTTRILPIVSEAAGATLQIGSYRDGHARLWGLTWGAEDLAADLGVLSNRFGGEYTEVFRHARTQCLLAAAAAGVRAIDTVCVGIDDDAAVLRDSIAARRDGFSGKMAVHPVQLGAINGAFTPTAEELDRARRIVAAFAARPETGAFRLDGEMVDRPHWLAARRLLNLPS